MDKTSSPENLEKEPRAEIVEYTDEYKDEVIKLIFEIAENELGHHSKSGRPDLYNIPEVYQKGKGNFWVATENGHVVGTIALREMQNERGDLWRFYVRKDLRRMGIGKKLFSALLEFAKENNYKEIFLSTQQEQAAANKFYTKNGFKEVESLPKDFSTSPNDKVFYELDLEEE